MSFDQFINQAEEAAQAAAAAKRKAQGTSVLAYARRATLAAVDFAERNPTASPADVVRAVLAMEFASVAPAMHQAFADLDGDTFERVIRVAAKAYEAVNRHRSGKEG